MLRAVSHPRFVFPVLFLTVLISLFLIVERQTEADARALQNILSQEIPQLAKRLQDVGVDFHEDKAVIDNLYSGIESKKTERKTLFILISLSSLLLLVFLLRNARGYQRNLKQVQTAEHYSALFAEALQTTRVGVIIRNMRGPEQPVVFVNKAFASLTGYDQVLMGGNKPDVLFGLHTDAAMIEAFQEAVRRGESSTFDFLIYRKDGSSFWSEWHISPVRDYDGTLTHYVSVLTDITGLRQTQEALMLAKEQAERASAVKTNFLATMSHEIRTPLNGLLGVLDLLKDSSLNEDQRKLLDIAGGSGRSLYEIINDILDYSKIEAGKVDIIVKPFSLKELLKDVIDLSQPVAASKNLAIKLATQDNLPDGLSGDAGRVRQILLNLLTNAIKYTDQGSVEIRVLHLLTQSKNERLTALLRFEVIDSGIGISAADQDKLFQEFSRVDPSYTCRFSGTGLGLAISRRLVKLLNGEIGVESKPGQGSKFWFMLPLELDGEKETANRQPVPAVRMIPARSAKNIRLLLVEDNETNRLIVGRYLGKAGYQHDVAVTGAEALSITTARAYDLILMDVSMPDMDGLEATRRIRALGGWAAAVPIIALTAHVMQGDRERCLAAGMNDHLGKPLDYETLVRTIETGMDTAAPPVCIERTVNGIPVPLAEMDSSVLQRLVDVLGPSSMQRITEVFLNDFDKRLADFKTNGEAPAMEKIGRAAHALKSSSANCGLMRFASLMADLEKAAGQGDQKGIRILLDQVNSACVMAQQVLIKERERYQQASATA